MIPYGDGPSGETRTRGILLPKQARYQLRYTRKLKHDFADASCSQSRRASCCGARNFSFADRSQNFDRCHSLGSLIPPPAAVASLPNCATTGYGRYYTRYFLKKQSHFLFFRESGDVCDFITDGAKKMPYSKTTKTQRRFSYETEK